MAILDGPLVVPGCREPGERVVPFCVQFHYGIEYMVNRNLIRTLDLAEEEWQQELDEALEAAPPEEIDWRTQEVAVNQIVEGRVLRIEGDFVLVDVGYKSEGIIFRNEWEEGEELPKPGRHDQGPHRRRRRHRRPASTIPAA